MSLVQEYHEARKARLVRMSGMPTIAPAIEPEPVRLPAPKPLSEDDAIPLAARPLVGDIRRLVCEYFGINNDLMLSETKHLSVTRPRQIGMLLSYRYSGRGFRYIAERFGRTDHTTPRSAVIRIEALCKTDWKLAYDVARLEVALTERFQCEL